MSSDTWRLLAELVRQLDDGANATTRSAATSLGIDKAQAENLHKALRRRGLIEEITGAPTRVGDRIIDRRVEITPRGMQAAASGYVD